MDFIYIGLAGWSEAVKTYSSLFPSKQSPLSSYSQLFNAVEINSSFYRTIPPSWYEKWYIETPSSFKFSVKAPRQTTHYSSLTDLETLRLFLENALLLKEKFAVLLIQLPPKLLFDKINFIPFITCIRKYFYGNIALEARNSSWDTPQVQSILKDYKISEVITLPDSEKIELNTSFLYIRLHGAPKKFYSSYDSPTLLKLAENLKITSGEKWIIFNNTASKAGIDNALFLKDSLSNQ